MKTLNRPTAPHPQLADLEALGATVRWMHRHEPPASTPDREAMVLSLTLLEMNLERMRIKMLVGDAPIDPGDVEHCRYELERLRNVWFGSD